MRYFCLKINFPEEFNLTLLSVQPNRYATLAVHKFSQERLIAQETGLLKYINLTYASNLYLKKYF